ncbi:MAG: hypothetical protein CME63_02390 [Halobacteriovoraceae bacterium]|nr:hypothetical protein [Halobacteriovoraceae bacterium]
MAISEEYRKFKPIRNRLRKLNIDSILFLIIGKVYHLEKSPIEEMPRSGMTTWELLLLLKWSIVFSSKETKRLATDKDIRDLLILNQSMNTDLGFDKSVKNQIIKFMRRAAFQQFWLQGNQFLNKSSIGRLIELYFKMDSKFDLNSFFISEISMTTKDVFDHLFIVWFFLESLNEENPYLNKGFFLNWNGYDENKLNTFLSLISINYDEAYDISNKSFNRNLKLQNVERSPFKDRPFLRTDKGLLCVSRNIYSYFMYDFLYSFPSLKSNGNFNRIFSDTFEDYVFNALNEITKNVKRDNFFKELFKDSKNADFLIVEAHYRLIIECKFIKLKEILQINPLDDLLKERLDKDIIKGVVQSIISLNNLEDINTSGCRFDNFIFVVTYSELFLGNGRSVWDEFLYDAVRSSYPDLKLDHFNPDCLFFVPIDDLDILCSIFKDKPMEMFEKLASIVEDNKKPENLKFVFNQYFPNESNKNRDRLVTNFEEYFNALLSEMNR